MSLTIAMLILGIIIVTHEFGHFLLARLNGIGVIEFSLGIGSRLFSFEKGSTRYSFKILSFGGSYTMLEEDEGITDESVFNNKSVRARISVVAAGPVFGFILAFSLSMVLIGITGYDTIRLAEAVDGHPARVAGIKAGDAIKSVNDRKVHSYRDISWYLFTHPQKSLKVAWERMEEGGGTECFNTELEPVLSAENNQYMAGIQFNPVPSMVENIGQLLVHSAYEVQYWVHYVSDTFYMMLHGIVSVNDISDPAGIVNATNTTADGTAPYGLSAVALILANFTILLSANLDVTNPLPIPVPDGGRLVFPIIKAVRGKLIDKEKEGMAHMAGMMVLLALMALILSNDVRKLF